MSTNIWIGIGRLIKDCELAFTQGKGTAIAKFTIAVDDGFGDKKTTDFIPIVVWGKQGEAVANYTQKGSKVRVTGKIKTRSYDAKDGSKRYVTEVVADMFNGVEFLDSKATNTNNQDGSIPQGYFGEEDNQDMPF